MTVAEFMKLKEGNIIEDITSGDKYYCASIPFSHGSPIYEIILYPYCGPKLQIRNAISSHADIFRKYLNGIDRAIKRLK